MVETSSFAIVLSGLAFVRHGNVTSSQPVSIPKAASAGSGCQSAKSEQSLFEIPLVRLERLIPPESASQASEPSHLEQSLRR